MSIRKTIKIIASEQRLVVWTGPVCLGMVLATLVFSNFHRNESHRPHSAVTSPPSTQSSGQRYWTMKVTSDEWRWQCDMVKSKAISVLCKQHLRTLQVREFAPGKEGRKEREWERTYFGRNREKKYGKNYIMFNSCDWQSETKTQTFVQQTKPSSTLFFRISLLDARSCCTYLRST